MANPTLLQSSQSTGGGRFTLTRALGRGGMGEVWLAQDERLHEPVALKFLPAEVRADATALDDLRRETARSHKLSHPNIIRIHDLHEDAGNAFISMEFVDGHTLAAYRVEQPTRVLSWEFLRPLVLQLCAALDYAHGEKVIHRDLKPANVMLDSKWRLKLADFGIAATVSDSVSRVSHRHATSGTLPYMSPQQLTGKRPTVTDDIYALGATLYELLTSKPPFHTGDLTHQVLNEPPEPMMERLAALEIQNEIPPEVAAVVMACLAKDPAQRPQTAAAVAEWLSGASVPQEIAPSYEATEVPAPTTAGNRSKVVWLTVSIVAVLVLVLGLVFWGSRRGAARRGNEGAATESAAGNGTARSASGAAGTFALASQAALPFTGSLAGTSWSVKDSDGESYWFYFERNGVLKYEASRGIQPNGRWQQDGTNVNLNLNDGFVIFSGTIQSGKMKGRALGRDGKSWNWDATPKN